MDYSFEPESFKVNRIKKSFLSFSFLFYSMNKHWIAVMHETEEKKSGESIFSNTTKRISEKGLILKGPFTWFKSS